MDKTIRVNYFAFIREERGLSSESCNTTAATLGDFYEELKARHGFSLSRQNIRVAKNDEFSFWDEPLRAGDEIAFIPPVAGG